MSAFIFWTRPFSFALPPLIDVKSTHRHESDARGFPLPSLCGRFSEARQAAELVGTRPSLPSTFSVLADVVRHESFYVCEARPDVRVRVRRSVVRIDVSDTAIRIRVVVRAVQHTGAPACLYLFFCRFYPTPLYRGRFISIFHTLIV